MLIYYFEGRDTYCNIGIRSNYRDNSLPLFSSVTPFGWVITVLLVISIFPCLTEGVDQTSMGTTFTIPRLNNIPSEITITGPDSIPTVFSKTMGTSTVCVNLPNVADIFNTNAQCSATFQSITSLPPSTVTETSTITSVITDGAKAYGNLTNPYKNIGIGGGSLVVVFFVALKAAAVAGIQDPCYAVFLGVFIASAVSLGSSFVYEGLSVLLH